MPIEPGAATVVLLAHQDDECGVFHVIESAIEAGDRVVCIYLTNGEWRQVSAATRNAESRSVLKTLGLADRDIIFLGDETAIASNALPARIAEADAALVRTLDRLGPVRRFVSLAWEGGHEDHDAACWLAVRHAERLGVLAESRLFPFYRSSLRRMPYYTLFKPLAANGPVREQRIPLGRRLAYLALCLRYRSQAMTFVGLMPFILRHYIVSGTQQLQPMLPERLREPPHAGTVLYEARGRARLVEVMHLLRTASPQR